MKFRQLSGYKSHTTYPLPLENSDKIGDWTFGHGFSNYVNAIDAVKLNVQTRLLSWQYNCFFDVYAGLPWNQFLGATIQQTGGVQDNTQNPNSSVITYMTTSMRALILQTDGVVGIADFSIKIKERSLSINVLVNSTYGDFDLSVDPLQNI